MEDEIQSFLQYLVANPVFLIPVLGIAAMMIYGILKKLLKLAAIAAIAGGLYLLMLRYLGSGNGF